MGKSVGNILQNQFFVFLRVKAVEAGLAAFDTYFVYLCKTTDMKADLNISLTFHQILDLVRQLPKEQKIKLTKALEKEAIETRLSDIIQSFRSDEISEDLINEEVEAVRQELYERSQKH